MKKKQKNENDKNKNGLIFTANTHPSPNFIVDEGVLKMIKGNATLKVYMVIIRHTIGFGADNIHLSNSTIEDKTGIDIRDVKRVVLELKNKYNLIHYESTNGGRAIKNIRILLPERFYSKEAGNEEDKIKELESKGYTVIPPAKKGDKPVLDSKPNSKNNSIIQEWNNFIVWGKKHLTLATQKALSNLHIEFKESEIVIFDKVTPFELEMVNKYFSEISKAKIKIIFKEGDK